MASLAKWLSVRLRSKWLWVRVPLQSLKPQTGVDTGCFRHRYADFGYTNLGVPKFNSY